MTRKARLVVTLGLATTITWVPVALSWGGALNNAGAIGACLNALVAGICLGVLTSGER